MRVSELERLCGATCLTGEYEDREIACGYTCDLLSHVMWRGQADMAWITVQTHLNVIAVAALMDFACVVFPEGLPVEAAIVDKARQEDVILLSSGQTAFELAALLALNPNDIALFDTQRTPWETLQRCHAPLPECGADFTVALALAMSEEPE